MNSLASLLVVSFLGQSGTQLLEFTSPSCVACRQMEPVIRRLEQQGHRVQQVRSDVPNRLVQQYNIRQLPTFVVVRNGKEIRRIVGKTSYDRLAQMLTPPGRSQDPRRFQVVPASHTQDVSPTRDISGTSRRATVRISVDVGDAYEIGSGVMIHRKGRGVLVVTCAHLFKRADRKQPIHIETFSAVGQTKPQKIPATLIGVDSQGDVALLTFNAPTEVVVAALAEPGTPVRSTQSVYATGCDRGKSPQVRFSRVTALNRRNGPANLQVAGVPANGCSGGGLFSTDGKLIGLCSKAVDAERSGTFAAYTVIHDLLRSSGLNAVLQEMFPAPRRREVAVRQPKRADATRVNLNAPPRSFSPGELDRDAAARNSRPVSLRGTRPNARKEVMIIVRDAKGQSRLVVLRNPSSRLLRMIEQEAEARTPANQTARRSDAPGPSDSRVVRGQRR